MGKRLRNIGIITILVLALSGCGKSETQAWVENTAALQAWYDAVTADTAEAKTHDEYVEQFLASHENVPDYGLAYGITAILCEELEVCDVSAGYTDEELATYFSDEEQMYLLDFTLPMFETYFFDEETVAYVQAAAVSFAEYVNEQGKLDELYQICLAETEEDETKLVELKNEWLVSIGVENVYEPFAVLPFEYNGRRELKEYPYVVGDAEANWYFHPDDVKEYGYKAFVEEYLITEELMVLDFPEARELFESFLPDEVPTVDICTMFYTKEGPAAALYATSRNHIELYYDWHMAKRSLVHEYVHYLTRGVEKLVLSSGFLAEGIAEETAVFGCENRLMTAGLKSIYAAEEEELKEVNLWDEEKECMSYKKNIHVMAHLYYAGVMVGEEYTTVFYDTGVRPEKIQFMSELSYQEMASLTHYLVELYGRDAVCEGFYNYDSFMKLVGKDFTELYDEWGAWNKEQCDKLGLEFIYE